MSQQTFNPTQELSEEVEANRQADHPINPLFVNRWSPRSYSDRVVREEDLLTVLEAARWAPSARNGQPWRFVLAKTEEQLQTFRELIFPNNRLWADQAPVIIALASYKLWDDGQPNRFHAFDSAAAWQALALQASLLGLSTRAIASFDQEKARTELNVPDDYDVHLLITLGYKGDPDSVHQDYRDLEKPNKRRPLNESIIEGKWGAPQA
ncbi:nitroreductase family protein [Paenibacillus sp. URB8-2]|uniref:nitroreductase family protein n=1 Tax=Paenibacillus sp. URB8-2 TaxID=2741301 RepID=UPI0015BFC30A|nr:nitroreductase family protein [Paenibacillus sp. URB8-2]BCG57685.1 nitroreductase [Paenibacillus sp. URB8-2]